MAKYGRKSTQIMIAIPNELHAVLSRFSKASGASMSSFIVGMLQSARPDLEKLIDTLERAQTKPIEALEALQVQFEDIKAGMDEEFKKIKRKE